MLFFCICFIFIPQIIFVLLLFFGHAATPLYCLQRAIEGNRRARVVITSQFEATLLHCNPDAKLPINPSGTLQQPTRPLHLPCKAHSPSDYGCVYDMLSLLLAPAAGVGVGGVSMSSKFKNKKLLQECHQVPQEHLAPVGLPAPTRWSLVNPLFVFHTQPGLLWGGAPEASWGTADNLSQTLCPCLFDTNLKLFNPMCLLQSVA